MNQFNYNQGARTKVYPMRYTEFAATQSVAKLAIAPRVATVLHASFVAPLHRIAEDTLSSSRLGFAQYSQQREFENISR